MKSNKQVALIVKEDGLIYLRSDTGEEVLCADQEKATEILIKSGVPVSMKSSERYLIAPGIYPIPDLQWEEGIEPMGADFPEFVKAGKVAILKESTPKAERDYSKFFTPSHIAQYLVSLLGPKSGDVVLEPSAGQGAIVRAIKQYSPDCVVFASDINESFYPYLRNAGADVVVIRDFLQIPITAKFSGCVANPPFGNGIDLLAHFNRIRAHVKDGGKIVMIVPEDFYPTIQCTEHPLDNWSSNSDGTTTPIKIIEFLNTESTPSTEQLKDIDVTQLKESEDSMWAHIIDDARWYNGTPQGLIEMTKHFKKQFTITRKP